MGQRVELRLLDPRDAVIDGRKVREYLLSASHPVGCAKARYFFQLGYRQESWQRFVTDLREQHLSRPAQLVATTVYGQKFRINARLVGPNGRAAMVATVWIVAAGESTPRLVTAYPGSRRR